MSPSLPRILFLWAGLAVACSGGGAPSSSASAPTAGESPAATPGQINGAGATFPPPIYSKWFAEYNKLHPDVRINYQSIGSGGGIRRLINQTVHPTDKERARIMVDFMRWALTDGQKYAAELGYAPLPERVVALELEALKKIG
jgi:ABC-type phosphate transport system substrate-binding protein